MMKEDWFILGKIGRPHGLRGAMVVHWSSAPEPSVFGLGKIALGPGEQAWSTMTVSRWRTLGSHKSLLLCEQITTCEQAQALVNAKVAVARHWLPPLPAKEWYLVDTIGSQVIDQHQQSLGEVVRFVEGPGQLFAVLMHQQEEHYLPLVPQWICRFARQEKQLHVQVPEGLFGTER